MLSKIESPNKFLWTSVFSLASALGLTYLNIYLGKQVYYLDYLMLFNALTISVLAFAALSIGLSMIGLWKARFKSIALILTGLVSSAFLVLLFFID